MSEDSKQPVDVTAHEARLKRLAFRSWHRGFKEADLMLGHFADKHLHTLTPDQLDRYETLLAADCHDLFGWIVGRAPVPAEHDHDVMTMIRSFGHLEEAMWPSVGRGDT